MDVIPSPTSLTPDLNNIEASADISDISASDETTLNTNDITTSADNTLNTSSVPESNSSQENNLESTEESETLSSVEIVCSDKQDHRTIDNSICENVDSDKINTPSNHNSDFSNLQSNNNKNFEECTTNNISDTSQESEPSKLEDTGDNLEAVSKEVDCLKEEVSKVIEDVDNVKEKVSENIKNVDNLEEDVSKDLENVDNVKEQNSNFKDDGKELVSNSSNLEDDGKELVSNSSNLKDDGKELVSNSSNLKDDGKELVSNSSNLKDDGKELVSNSSNLKDDGKELVSNSSNLKDDEKELVSNSNSEDLDNINEQISTEIENVESVKEQMPDEISSINKFSTVEIDAFDNENNVKTIEKESTNQINEIKSISPTIFDPQEKLTEDKHVSTEDISANNAMDIENNETDAKETSSVESVSINKEVPETSEMKDDIMLECVDEIVSDKDKEVSKDNESQIEETAMEVQEDSLKSLPITEVDANIDDIESEENQQTNDVLSEVDEQSMDQDLQQENPVFVHVSTKTEGEGEKSLSSDVDLQNETCDESMEVSCLVEEDPIGINQDTEKDVLMDFTEDVSDKEPLKVVDFNDETITSDKSAIDDELVASKGADEELCIIPDTEREISQEEKDAATAAAAAAAEIPRSKEDTSTTTVPSKSPSRTEEDSSSVITEKPAKTVQDSNEKATGEDFMATISVINHASFENSDASKKPIIKVTDIPEALATEQNCQQCDTVRKCLYKVDNSEKETFICTEACLISFRALSKPANEDDTGLKSKDIGSKLPGPRETVFVRKCAECIQKISVSDEKVLSWETMDYCNEDCLSKYQNKIGSHCANCKKVVLMGSLGKYCVRFGHDIRQFCCSLCLEEFKKGLKVCSYCQKDISAGTEGFLAPVGDKGQFKDFCSQLCMEKYDQMSNKNTNNKATIPVDISQCSVCNNEKQIQVYFEQVGKKNKFCGDPCFVAFKFVNQTQPLQCDMCKNYFENENCTEFSIFYDNIVKNFCCKTCQNIYIIANRRIVPCSWCKVKKYNFDMIKKSCVNGRILMMCSLNCLSLFQVSVNAVSSKKMKCDNCGVLSQAQYHLTMSDATMRNFCTYHCVMTFQSQFAKHPITLGTSDKTVNKPVPAGGPKKYQRTTRSSSNDAAATAELQMPVITNVQSLANTTNGPSSVIRQNAQKIVNNQQSTPQPPTSPKPQTKQQVIIKAPPLPPMKNAATWCKPILHTKGVSCRPHPCSKETQTEEIREKTILVPVPVPIYVPAPMHMFSAPIPVPIPFPLPIPVPIFIPTTRNSAAGIMKEIKKIQVKIPTDPFEAELLMMAEMVAGEKKVDNTDSESEEDDNGDAAADGGFSPEAVDTSNTFGDDMLQMALKMATELDEPAVDLEGALTANTITASQNQDSAVVTPEEAVDDPQPIHQLMDRQAIRGRKRSNRQPRNINPSKRGRRMSTHVEIPLLPAPQPTQPPEPIEKPDANMCLKYTFGVNAWKQWVTTKNAELEKSSRRVKLFKNEILQLTADELNYSLCLFVKEVRKPNGTEYAPDTIYYLCLGIQQYLFENGRIDNIFTDTYYEKFTDCLDEVARKFSVLYNDSHYIVTRVEEEHLWESKQLGAHSPHVLLSTLMFFNTKHFNLTTVDEHMQLSFSHIMKHWKRNPNQPGAAKIPGSRNVLLRFYPPQTTLDSNSRKKKVYEQQENEENPLRCPVKLYEFYLSKCPESVKTRNDVFYLLPERSCVPDSPVWYSTMALGREALEKMLHRVKMVKEINVALLTS